MSTTPIAKLLIVDDEAALMTALCKTLEQQGYDVTYLFFYCSLSSLTYS